MLPHVVLVRTDVSEESSAIRCLRCYLEAYVPSALGPSSWAVVPVLVWQANDEVGKIWKGAVMA
jgi:hypothetical protein